MIGWLSACIARADFSMTGFIEEIDRSKLGNWLSTLKIDWVDCLDWFPHWILWLSFIHCSLLVVMHPTPGFVNLYCHQCLLRVRVSFLMNPPLTWMDITPRAWIEIEIGISNYVRSSFDIGKSTSNDRAWNIRWNKWNSQRRIVACCIYMMCKLSGRRQQY